jgi:hypothetical protein
VWGQEEVESGWDEVIANMQGQDEQLEQDWH